MMALRIPEDASDVDIINVDSRGFWYLMCDNDLI